MQQTAHLIVGLDFSVGRIHAGKCVSISVGIEEYHLGYNTV
jgi:hypothetical protein